MNFKTTIGLIICLLIVGMAALLTRNRSTEPPPPPTPAKYVDMPSADVTKLVIEPASDKRIVLEKRGAIWQMLEPINSAADLISVDNLVRAITDLEVRGQVDPSGANAEATGLNQPGFRIELTDKSGKIVKMAVGNPSGVGDNLYVQKEGEKQAALVPAAVYQQLIKPASTYRSMQLVDAKSPEIREIEIKRTDSTVTLKKDGDKWQVGTGPTTMPADQNAASDLLFALSGLRATEIVTEKADDPKRFGMDPPAITVSFSAQPVTTQPSTQPAKTGSVKFGRYEDLRKQNVFVMSSISDAVAKVPASAMQTFEKKPLELRDKTVLTIAPADVESFTIQISKPAATQPTSRPANESLVTITRNKAAAAQSWRAPFALPDGAASTMPSIASSQPATAPASGGVAASASEPTSAPTTIAATEPSTAPAIALAPHKWEITSDPDKGPAEDQTVDALLHLLDPLKAEKYLDKSSTTQPVDQYTLTISTMGSAAGNHTITINDPGVGQNPIGHYGDLTFEVGRLLIDKLGEKFTPAFHTTVSPTP